MKKNVFTAQRNTGGPVVEFDQTPASSFLPKGLKKELEGIEDQSERGVYTLAAIGLRSVRDHIELGTVDFSGIYVPDGDALLDVKMFCTLNTIGWERDAEIGGDGPVAENPTGTTGEPSSD